MLQSVAQQLSVGFLLPIIRNDRPFATFRSPQTFARSHPSLSPSLETLATQHTKTRGIHPAFGFLIW